MAVEKVLIFKLGSLGDTIVSLPALHLVARKYPDAERGLLGNLPVSERAASPKPLLQGSGLIHDYFSYRGGLGNLRELWQLRCEIKAWSPDRLVYLGPARGLAASLRYFAFFKACGISEIIGLPFRVKNRLPQYDPVRKAWESETERLLRNLTILGDMDLKMDSSWDLSFSPQEEEQARSLLVDWNGADNFIGFSVGAKIDVKDWGDKNWAVVLSGLGERHPNLGLAAIGSGDERTRSESLMAGWRGPKLNLCGQTAPRISALVLRQARIFLGHDSGPMHLAALVGTPCVAVFSSRDKPGIWFPRGERNRILYNRTDCFGCRLESCTEHKKKCILGISPEEVLKHCTDLLNKVS